jgi:hypothetical protein
MSQNGGKNTQNGVDKYAEKIKINIYSSVNSE